MDFYKSCDFFCLNDKANTLKHCQLVIESFQPQQRYVRVAELMWDQAINWKDGDLADIGRDMRISGDRLDRSLGDKVTRDMQAQILRKLDALIDEQSKPPSDGEKSKSPSNPIAPTETPGDVSGKGIVDERALKHLADVWGKLPEAERAKAIQELSSQLPPKWKPLIDDYNSGLTKRPGG